MKQLTNFLSLMLLSLAALTGTASNAFAEKVNKSWFGNTAIEGYDTVAYFTDGTPVKGSSEHAHTWHGASWYFSNAENLAKFKQSPAAYAPQYGGFCAYAVAKNGTAGIDPSQWTIVEGKLYLNYNAKIQKKWLRERASFIAQADKNWPEINK